MLLTFQKNIIYQIRKQQQRVVYAQNNNKMQTNNKNLKTYLSLHNEDWVKPQATRYVILKYLKSIVGNRLEN